MSNQISDFFATIGLEVEDSSLDEFLKKIRQLENRLTRISNNNAFRELSMRIRQAAISMNQLDAAATRRQQAQLRLQRTQAQNAAQEAILLLMFNVLLK